MKKSMSPPKLKVLTWLLIFALLAIGGVILWKRMEYAASEHFYQNLRSLHHIRRISA